MQAATKFVTDSITYQVVDETAKTVEVVRGTNPAYDNLKYVIPANVSNAATGTAYRVIGIADMTFSGTKATSILLPEGLEYIGYYVFPNVNTITEMIVPNTVTKVGKWGFRAMYGLEKLVLSENLTDIAEGICWGNSKSNISRYPTR